MPELVVNPYASWNVVASKRESKKLRVQVTAPKRNFGLKKTEFTASSNSSVIRQLLAIRRRKRTHLDVDGLDADSKRRLRIAGVLVPMSRMPFQPFYECWLWPEVNVSPVSRDTLGRLTINRAMNANLHVLAPALAAIVPESLKFNPPTIWIKQVDTHIVTPIWLTPDERKVLTTIESSPHNIRTAPKDLIARFRAAGIVVTDNRTRPAHGGASSRVTRHSEFTLITNVLGPYHLVALQRYYSAMIEEGFWHRSDARSNRRYNSYEEGVTAFFHRQMGPWISRITNQEWKSSYCYTASYRPGSVLPKHTDRAQCELTLSLLIDYRSRTSDPWPLYLELKGGARAICMSVNEGLLFRGRQVAHYRKRLRASCQSTSAFFHFVLPDFEGDLA